MRKIIAAFAFAAIASGTTAEIVVVDITGVESRDQQGNPINVVLGVNLGAPNAEVTGIGWNLIFFPNWPSWTSEPHMTYGNTSGPIGYDWDMGGWGGVDNSTPISLIGSNTTSFLIGGDGILRIEFWEDFDDFPGEADGVYDGLLTIEFIPVETCSVPSDCDDLDVCTLDACAGGFCSHDPATYGDADGSGVVDLDDILCVIAGFGNFKDCPTADIAGCQANGLIDLDDILVIIGAFGGADPCCGG